MHTTYGTLDTTTHLQFPEELKELQNKVREKIKEMKALHESYREAFGLSKDYLSDVSLDEYEITILTKCYKRYLERKKENLMKTTYHLPTGLSEDDIVGFVHEALIVGKSVKIY